MGLEERIIRRSAQVSVIGLGYVGLPLALACARAGFPTLGVELDPRKVEAINRAESYIEDVPDAALAPHVQEGRLRATTDYAVLHESDVIFICVPTPYTEQRTPDLSYVMAATEGIVPHLRPEQLIVLQSTTYPGTTTEIVQPVLERSGLRAGQDFYLAFSPERIDPGNPTWSAYNTPKVVGGLTPRCTALAAAFLRQMGAPVYEVSTPAAAELTKILENTFRAVNIALVNEVALLAERMRIDVWEVIEAAKTKPFGFMPFYPGPGVGGHCIPIDPFYLLWKAREYDFYTRFIELAAETNEAMPYHVVELLTRGLGRLGKPLEGAHVLVLGVAFKPNIGDERNSPAQRIMELLHMRRVALRYHDPYVPTFQVGGNAICPQTLHFNSEPLTAELLRAVDAVVIVTGHRTIDYPLVLEHAALVVDTCNATRGREGMGLLVRLGAPLP